MLFDNEGKKITVITRDSQRKKLYDIVMTELRSESIQVKRYMMDKIDNYFSTYESEGKQGHLKAAYIFGGEWDGTPLQKIYDILLLLNCSNEELAYEQSKEIVGCLIRQVMIDDNQNEYLGQYQPDSGYIYTR